MGASVQASPRAGIKDLLPIADLGSDSLLTVLDASRRFQGRPAGEPRPDEQQPNRGGTIEDRANRLAPKQALLWSLTTLALEE